MYRADTRSVSESSSESAFATAVRSRHVLSRCIVTKRRINGSTADGYDRERFVSRSSTSKHTKGSPHGATGSSKQANGSSSGGGGGGAGGAEDAMPHTQKLHTSRSAVSYCILYTAVLYLIPGTSQSYCMIHEPIWTKTPEPLGDPLILFKVSLSNHRGGTVEVYQLYLSS